MTNAVNGRGAREVVNARYDFLKQMMIGLFLLTSFFDLIFKQTKKHPSLWTYNRIVQFQPDYRVSHLRNSFFKGSKMSENQYVDKKKRR